VSDLAHGLAPKMKPISRKRSAIVCGLDIGTSKIVCVIARLKPRPPQDVLPRRTHAIEVLGIGHAQAQGMKSGNVVDIVAAEEMLRHAVDGAERGAGVHVDSVVLPVTAGRTASELFAATVHMKTPTVGDADIERVLAAGSHHSVREGRAVLHSLPIGYALDDSRGIRDPRGMLGEKLGVNMHVVTASAASVRNHTAAVGRSHLEVEALVVSPYASGLSCLVEDEIGLGVTVIDMGGGTTTIGVFFDGNLIFADYVPVGGMHVTNDIARGLSTGVAHAERMKTLFGTAISASTDEREMIAVPQIGEEDEGHVNHVPKSLLVGIIAPRIEETFELVRNRLEASGFDKVAGRRVVLTGGASQLHGAREFAGLILDKQVRMGRPQRVAGLAESTGGPAFATTAGLLHFALSERAEVSGARRSPAGSRWGVLGRLGNWLKDNF